MIGAFIERFESYLTLLQSHESEVRLLLNVPAKVLAFIRLNPRPIAALDYIVYYHTWHRELKFLPSLQAFGGQQLMDTVVRNEAQRAVDFEALLETILRRKKQNWQMADRLMQSPAARLSESDKALKKQLKAAHRILIHELNKQQRFLPVQALMIQAADMIFDLQSVWLMNPLSVAEYLPLTQDLFDLVIFDESSQIPLEDAIPALYRAQQAICGG